MRKAKSRVPGEYDYVARRVAHPWLLRQLYACALPRSCPETGSFVGRICDVIGIPRPEIIWQSRGTSGALAEDWALAFGPRGEQKGSISAGTICHELAHLMEYLWCQRMRLREEARGPRHHNPAFVDQLDTVVIEAAKLLE